jgi:uncharacterized protein YqcC (DUF446 family)
VNPEIREWMGPMIAAVQPYCDETIIAAHTFQAARGWASGVLGGLLYRGPFPRPPRRVRERAGGLPETVILAVGPTKVFVFPYRTKRLQLDVGPPVRVWTRGDLRVTGKKRLVASKLTIDVESTGDHHELESTSMTGRLGKMTRAMFDLLASHRGEAEPRLRARLGELADDIEAELKRTDMWIPDPPSEETVLAGGAFGLKTVPFDAWLQVVFVPRLRQVAAGEFPVPESSSVGAQAVREYDSDPLDRGPLMDLLNEVDGLVNAGA